SARPRTSGDRWRGVHHGGGLPWGQVLAARVFRGLVAAGDHPGPRPRAVRLRGPCLRSTILPPVSERRIDSPLERPQTERPGTRALLEERRRGLSKYVALWTEVMDLIEAMVLESPPPSHALPGR